MAVVDFDDSAVGMKDHANRSIIGRVNSQTVEYPLFNNIADAWWAADRALRLQAYPFAKISFPANRNVFRLQPGDLFKFSYEKYSIVDMVVRVIQIEEGDLQDESIMVFCQEDVDYISTSSDLHPENPTKESKPSKDKGEDIAPLEYVEVLESPYAVSGDAIQIITLASRETDSELGYVVYISPDGTTYSELGRVASFTPHATLVDAYPSSTNKIDDTDVGMVVEFENNDADRLDTITRAELFGTRNFMAIGDEFLSWETITPIAGDQYRITGVLRGRWDTAAQNHSIGDSVWFGGPSSFGKFSSELLTVGSTRYFKFVPYSRNHLSSISDATAIPITIGGRSRKPYVPINFKANGYDVNPTYSTDIELVWAPRKRDSGAGFGIGLEGGTGSYDWEGYFEIKIYEGIDLVRSVSGIDYILPVWTYTQALREEDTESPFGDDLIFYLRNCRVHEDGKTYCSDYTTLTVEGV